MKALPQRTVICAAALHCFLPFGAAHATAATRAVPPDLVVRAQFFPGAGSGWVLAEEAAKMPKPWTVKIAANGQASQATTFVSDPSRSLPMMMRPRKSDPAMPTEEMRKVDPPHIRHVQLSDRQVQQIADAIHTAKFFTLPQELASSAGYHHTASIVLQVTMKGRSREVAFEWPNGRFDRSELLRFWRVWSAVTRAIPSPNHNNELDYWAHAVRLRLPK